MLQLKHLKFHHKHRQPEEGVRAWNKPPLEKEEIKGGHKHSGGEKSARKQREQRQTEATVRDDKRNSSSFRFSLKIPELLSQVTVLLSETCCINIYFWRKDSLTEEKRQQRRRTRDHLNHTCKHRKSGESAEEQQRNKSLQPFTTVLLRTRRSPQTCPTPKPSRSANAGRDTVGDVRDLKMAASSTGAAKAALLIPRTAARPTGAVSQQFKQTTVTARFCCWRLTTAPRWKQKHQRSSGRAEHQSSSVCWNGEIFTQE